MADFGENILLEAGDMDQATLSSNVFDSTGLQTFKIITSWTNVIGSLIGTLSLESSNDGIVFTEIEDSSQAITDSGTNFHIWDFPYNPFVLIRAKYVKTSGDADLKVLAQFGG